MGAAQHRLVIENGEAAREMLQFRLGDSHAHSGRKAPQNGNQARAFVFKKTDVLNNNLDTSGAIFEQKHADELGSLSSFQAIELTVSIKHGDFMFCCFQAGIKRR